MLAMPMWVFALSLLAALAFGACLAVLFWPWSDL